MEDKKVNEKEEAVVETEPMLEGVGDVLTQEGQESALNVATLPILNREEDLETKKILEGAGVKFIGAVEGDPKLQYVELPKGWEIRPTEAHGCFTLEDDRGRVRAIILDDNECPDFRITCMWLVRRFDLGEEFHGTGENRVLFIGVWDDGTLIHSSNPIPVPIQARGVEHDMFCHIKKVATYHVRAWLESAYPGWQKPDAYWKDEEKRRV